MNTVDELRKEMKLKTTIGRSKQKAKTKWKEEYGNTMVPTISFLDR